MCVDVDLRSPVFVLGLPRSGTTWVGRALATALGGRYVHEPWRPETEAMLRWQMPHLPSSDPQPDFDAALLRRRPGPGSPTGRTVVKDVHVLTAAGYLRCRFGAPIAIVVRHPAAMAVSWRRLGFAHPADPLRRLVDRWGSRLPYEVSITGDHFTDAGTYWGLGHALVQRVCDGDPGVVWVRHQDLVGDPAGWSELLLALGLADADHDALAKFIADHDRDADPAHPYVPVRRATQVVDAWRAELVDVELTRVLDAARRFSLMDQLYPSELAGSTNPSASKATRRTRQGPQVWQGRGPSS